MAATNNHGLTKSIQGPLAAGAAVVTSDSVDLAYETRALYVGVAGDVKVILAQDGSALVFKAVPVGMLNVAVTRVYATGTTATNILALY